MEKMSSLKLARKFLGIFAIVVLWPIFSLFIAFLICLFFGSLIDGSRAVAEETLKISQLGIAFTLAGFIAIFTRFSIRKTAAFCYLSLPSILLSLWALASHASAVGMVSGLLPLLLWPFVKKMKNDVLSKSIRGLFRTRMGRSIISLYAGWVTLVVLTNTFTFEDILDPDYFDHDWAAFLFTVPPIMSLMGFALFRWCRRGA